MFLIIKKNNFWKSFWKKTFLTFYIKQCVCVCPLSSLNVCLCINLYEQIAYLNYFRLILLMMYQKETWAMMQHGVYVCICMWDKNNTFPSLYIDCVYTILFYIPFELNPTKKEQDDYLLRSGKILHFRPKTKNENQQMCAATLLMYLYMSNMKTNQHCSSVTDWWKLTKLDRQTDWMLFLTDRLDVILQTAYIHML